MSTPIVVQGSAVASPFQHSSAPSGSASPDTFTKGEKQPASCRDPIFAALLWMNVIAVAAVVGIYGASSFAEALENANVLSGYAYAAAVTGVFSIICAALALSVMMWIPELVIKISLMFSIIMAAIWCAASFYYGQLFAGVIGAIYFCLMVCYAYAVRSRIPFASANLVTGITAVKKNSGIIFVAYVYVALAFAWSILWVIAALSVFEMTSTCADGNQSCEINYGYLFLLLVSYFFTHQVIQNAVHVTTSGIVGTWWHVPEEAQSFCSAAVKDSWWRAMTTSFGSICFGSLIVAIIQALKQLVNAARGADDGYGILLCIIECLLGCIESIVEYFNKWAFVYVGLYGYSYLEAGKNVMTLFQSRGWEAVIADDLVSNALFFFSVAVGLLSGAVGVVLAITTDWFDSNTTDSGELASFVLGLIIGLVLTSIMMSVVGSSVNAVIVCFAESPAEFQQNHPELSQRMRETWSALFPGMI